MVEVIIGWLMVLDEFPCEVVLELFDDFEEAEVVEIDAGVVELDAEVVELDVEVDEVDAVVDEVVTGELVVVLLAEVELELVAEVVDVVNE